MKKILTIFAVTLFAFTLRAETGVGVNFWFDEDAPVTYPETDDPLVENEVFRVLAVFPNASINNPNALPFEMSPEGEPILTVTGTYAWMRMKVSGVEQTYAPVGESNLGVPVTKSWGKTCIRSYLNKEDLPEGYSDTQDYYVYLVAFDARQNDGIVPEGLPTRINHWGAVYSGSFRLVMSMPQDWYVNMPSELFPLAAPSPTRDPYVEGPNVPDGTSDDVKVAAIAALKAALTDDAYAEVESIYNPDVGAKINGLITGSGCVTVDKGVATFTYAFGVSAISVDGDEITVTVALGKDQTFVDGVTVTLVDLEGTALTDVTATTVGESGKNTAKVTIQVDPDNIGTLIFKAKAMKADQTNEESTDSE